MLHTQHYILRKAGYTLRQTKINFMTVHIITISAINKKITYVIFNSYQHSSTVP